ADGPPLHFCPAGAPSAARFFICQIHSPNKKGEDFSSPSSSLRLQAFTPCALRCTPQAGAVALGETSPERLLSEGDFLAGTPLRGGRGSSQIGRAHV